MHCRKASVEIVEYEDCCIADIVCEELDDRSHLRTSGTTDDSSHKTGTGGRQSEMLSLLFRINKPVCTGQQCTTSVSTKCLPRSECCDRSACDPSCLPTSRSTQLMRMRRHPRIATTSHLRSTRNSTTRERIHDHLSTRFDGYHPPCRWLALKPSEASAALRRR